MDTSFLGYALNVLVCLALIGGALGLGYKAANGQKPKDQSK